MASNQNQQSDMWSDIELHSLYDVSHSTDFTWCSKKSLFKRSREVLTYSISSYCYLSDLVIILIGLKYFTFFSVIFGSHLSVQCVLCITTVCIVMMVLGTIVEDHDISNYQPDIVQPPHTNLSITLT